MSTQARRSKEIVIASLAVVAIAVLAVALLGNFGHPPQQTFSKATLSGKITGKVYTPGNAVGNVTALLFRPVNNSTQLKGLPANLDANGSYSITLTNGINYKVSMYVVDPTNDEDTGFCQGQTVVLNDLHVAAYSFDITPFGCGQTSDFGF
ncbi:MAG: hypothetical protein OK455_06905 [Thaumarchaeota archaeon]|nr:hypothetical protein [Nitrososphaerota archaeon]